jgi:APA family basic amino acid/polyamine antiporter
VAATNVLSAIAFLFVAYTGYGRIATLGEEVRDPGRTIPRAVIATLGVSVVLYTAVAAAGWRLAGSSWGTSASERAPLAAMVGRPWDTLIEVGAITAMVGVLVNLVLGLSRVWLAMGRRSDMPAALASIGANGSPTTAVIVAGMAISGMALVDDVRITWSFSAFAVLLYYAITNLAALRLTPELRRFPRWVSIAGLASCAFLSFWVPVGVWLTGVAVTAAGLLWRLFWRRRAAVTDP